ncbi:MAG: DNA-processing protein DprA [Fimbriimonadaceae bacterium]|nr:DNA-processing protein DprA [Fimbriimonadaceae bacterium]
MSRSLGSADYWQFLLAAELPFHKLEPVVRWLEGNSLPDARQRILACPLLSDAERQRVERTRTDGLEKALALGVQAISVVDLPLRLQPVRTFFAGLFLWGDRQIFEQPTVAVVGTRAASTYGKAVTQKFVERLVGAGVAVVSGGALGVDAVAHQSALKCGGKTAAVLATGIEGVYPASHRTLFQQIRESGCLASQFAVGHKPREHTFLQRNAVIAALSDAVLIIEAPERSGSLATANAAVELGKQVFVVPSNVSMSSFRGSHHLIRLGATLVDHPDQILEDLNLLDLSKPSGRREVAESDHAILKALSVHAMPAEKIAMELGLDPADVLSELTILEIDGKVIRSDGGYIIAP